MAQYARPTADISTGTWGPTPLYALIDEDVPTELDVMQSAQNPTNDVAEVLLTPLTDPNSATGYILRYAYRKDSSGGSEGMDLIVTLLEGTTTIASWTHTNISADLVTAEQTLTTPQTDAITDHANLRVRFSATQA